jgi:hypothetical protein
MMPAARHSYLSSRLVREVAQLGGPVDCLVPELVVQKLREKMDVANKFSDGGAGAHESGARATERLNAERATERKTKSRKRKS